MVDAENLIIIIIQLSRLRKELPNQDTLLTIPRKGGKDLKLGHMSEI